MDTDFLDSHDRHWMDAETLAGGERWANADHLYGIAAECGVKRLMLALGMRLSFDGAPEMKEDRKHADAIWARFESYREASSWSIEYTLPPANPFADWHISQRYSSQANFDKDRTIAHKAGAEVVRSLVRRAQMDGLIRQRSTAYYQRSAQFLNGIATLSKI